MKNKPVSMVINEFKINIEKTINESGLPPVIIEPVLNNYFLQIQALAKQQAIADMREYENEEKENIEE